MADPNSSDERKKAREAYLRTLESQKQQSISNQTQNGSIQSQNQEPKSNKRLEMLEEKRKRFFEQQQQSKLPFVSEQLNVPEHAWAVPQDVTSKFENYPKNVLIPHSETPNLKNYAQMGYPSEYAYAKALGSLEVKKQVLDIKSNNNYNVERVGHEQMQDQLLIDSLNIPINDDKALKNRKQTDYIFLLKQDEDAQQQKTRHIPPIQPLTEQLGINIGTDQDKNSMKKKQNDYARQLEQDQKNQAPQSLSPLPTRSIPTDPVQNFESGLNFGNNPDKILMKQKQLDYARQLQQDQGKQRQNHHVDNQINSHPSGMAQQQSIIQEGGINIGSDHSRVAARQKQAEYAMLLKQDQGNTHPSQVSPQNHMNHHRSDLNQPSSNDLGLNIGADQNKIAARQKQAEYAMQLKQDQRHRSDPSSNHNHSPAGTGLEIGRDQDKAVTRQKQAEYARQLQDQGNAYPPQISPQHNMNRPRNDPYQPSSNDLGLNIGADQNKIAARQKQAEYAMQLKQDQRHRQGPSSNQNVQYPPSGTGLNVGGDQDKGSIRQKQAEYARQLQDQRNSYPSQVSPQHMNQQQRNYMDQPVSNELGFNIGGNNDTAAARRKQANYAQQLQQNQLNNDQYAPQPPKPYPNNTQYDADPYRNERPRESDYEMNNQQNHWYNDVMDNPNAPYRNEFEMQNHQNYGNNVPASYQRNPYNPQPDPMNPAMPQRQAVPVGQGGAGFNIGGNPMDEKAIKRLKQAEYARGLQEQMLHHQTQATKQPSQQKRSDLIDNKRDNSNVLASDPDNWVMGPLGVPVRKTFEVGNRGLQKAFTQQQKVQPVPSQGDIFNKPEYGNNRPYGMGNDMYSNNMPESDYCDPAPMNPYTDNYGMNKRDEYNPNPNHKILPSDDLDERARKAKLLQVEQARALEHQIRMNKEMKELEKKKIEAEEMKQMERMEQQRIEMAKAYEMEQKEKKMKLEEENKRQLTIQIEVKKKQKEDEEKKIRMEEEKEAARIQQEHQKLLRQQEEEMRREAMPSQKNQANPPSSSSSSSSSFLKASDDIPPPRANVVHSRHGRPTQSDNSYLFQPEEPPLPSNQNQFDYQNQPPLISNNLNESRNRSRSDNNTSGTVNRMPPPASPIKSILRQNDVYNQNSNDLFRNEDENDWHVMHHQNVNHQPLVEEDQRSNYSRGGSRNGVRYRNRTKLGPPEIEPPMIQDRPPVEWMPTDRPKSGLVKKSSWFNDETPTDHPMEIMPNEHPPLQPSRNYHSQTPNNEKNYRMDDGESHLQAVGEALRQQLVENKKNNFKQDDWNPKRDVPTPPQPQSRQETTEPHRMGRFSKGRSYYVKDSEKPLNESIGFNRTLDNESKFLLPDGSFLDPTPNTNTQSTRYPSGSQGDAGHYPSSSSPNKNRKKEPNFIQGYDPYPSDDNPSFSVKPSPVKPSPGKSTKQVSFVDLNGKFHNDEKDNPMRFHSKREDKRVGSPGNPFRATEKFFDQQNPSNKKDDEVSLIDFNMKSLLLSSSGNNNLGSSNHLSNRNPSNSTMDHQKEGNGLISELRNTLELLKDPPHSIVSQPNRMESDAGQDTDTDYDVDGIFRKNRRKLELLQNMNHHPNQGVGNGFTSILDGLNGVSSRPSSSTSSRPMSRLHNMNPHSLYEAHPSGLRPPYSSNSNMHSARSLRIPEENDSRPNSSNRNTPRHNSVFADQARRAINNTHNNMKPLHDDEMSEFESYSEYGL